MNQRRLKIAVLGTGAIVERAHLPGLVADGNVEIHLFGRNRQRLDVLGNLFTIAKSYTSMEECLGMHDLDGAIIALPNFMHGDAAFMAIERRLPILLEKPIAHEIQTSREIVSRAIAADVPIHLNLPQRHRPSIRAMKQVIDSGAIGKIRTIDVSMLRQSGIPGFGTWFTQRQFSGGGVLADLGPHMLDIAFHLAGSYAATVLDSAVWSDLGPRARGLGDLTEHRAIEDEPQAQFNVDDRAIVRLEGANGVRITCEVAWAYNGPDENRVRIVGEHGGLDYWPETYGLERPLVGYGDVNCLHSFPSDHQDLSLPWRKALESFLNAIRLGDDTSDSVTGLAVAECISTVYAVRK